MNTVSRNELFLRTTHPGSESLRANVLISSSLHDPAGGRTLGYQKEKIRTIEHLHTVGRFRADRARPSQSGVRSAVRPGAAGVRRLLETGAMDKRKHLCSGREARSRANRLLAGRARQREQVFRVTRNTDRISLQTDSPRPRNRECTEQERREKGCTGGKKRKSQGTGPEERGVAAEGERETKQER